MIVDISLEQTNYRMYLPNFNQDAIQKYIFSTKLPYEQSVLEYILKDAQMGGGIVLDIGANIGNHSVYLAAHNIKVLSFEPNPKLCKIIKENIKINHFENKIKLFECGISDTNHKANLSKENRTNYGSMSLIKNNQGEIECKSIDSFNFEEKISLIKIDVEGMELSVLKGAKQTLIKNKPTLYLEANQPMELYHIKQFLEKLGYIYYNLQGQHGAYVHIFVYKNIINKELLKENFFNNFGLVLLNSVFSNRFFYRKIKQVRILVCVGLGLVLIQIILNILFFIFLFFKG